MEKEKLFYIEEERSTRHTAHKKVNGWRQVFHQILTTIYLLFLMSLKGMNF